MKILYIPCHVTLEYDEINLLSELGHEVFSTGLYGDPESLEINFNNYKKKEKQYSHERPLIKNYKPNINLINKYKSNSNNIFSYGERSYSFPKDFMDYFDLIYINHYAATALRLAKIIKDKPIVFNTVSQTNRNQEIFLKFLKKVGIKIIRFYDTEKNITGSVEEDAIIPQYVDKLEYQGWEGTVKEVLSVCRGIPARPIHTNADLYWLLSVNLPVKLVGPGNESIPSSIGNLSYKDLKKAYRDHRLFFNLGTKPGGIPYTCLEAMMTGCPIVSVGKVLGGSFDLGIGDTNAIPKFINNGLNGFYSDNPQELIENCICLLEDENLAKKISIEVRNLAIKYFSKEVIKEKWEEFLNKIA